MSFSAPQSKMPSPARTPRESGEMSERYRPAKANKPPGIVNMGMTCFLNSTFQALSATPALISLLSNNPALPLYPAPGSLLPAPSQAPLLTPCLGPDVLEPPLYSLLPVTRAFTNSLHKSWTTKERGGGIAGPGESSTVHTITLSQLLREMARKYDQYDAFAQQDAHELLRHLLDSMEMEEKDVIKRKYPSAKPLTPNVLPAALSPEVGTTPLPPQGAVPPSPAMSGLSMPEEQRMLPFVDLLFGGLLASVVVCDSCKSVSHTYEGFLDLSLSMRGDDDAPRVRKRDRFRNMFKPRSVSSSRDSLGVMSEPEGSDSELGTNRSHRHRRHHTSRDSDAEEGSSLSRHSSSAKSIKASFSFRRKQKAPPSPVVPGSSPISGGSSHSLPTGQPPSAPGTPTPSSPSLLPQASPLLASEPVPATSQNTHPHQAAPTPAQAAYIARILYGPPVAPESADPLAKLRAAHAGGLSAAPSGKPQEYGLIESLKAFTGVETLEGDNAFACHKCWKIKNGHYKKHGEKAGSEHSTAPGSTQPSAVALPSIAVEESESEMLPPPNMTESSRLGRLVSRGSRMSSRPTSPLRRLVEHSPSPEPGANGAAGPSPSQSTPSLPEDISRVDTTVSADSTLTGHSESQLSIATSGTSTSTPTVNSLAESDGLSDSDSESDEELPHGPARFFRPNLARRQSKHFILRRAFKRYLIAKAPEVLVFHIKRFKQSGSGAVYSSFSSLKKLEDMVTFPETLDLAPFMAPNRADFKCVRTPEGMRAPYMNWPSPEQPPESAPMPYRLYAVVVHLGTMLSGHYIAYVLVDPEKMFLPPGETPASAPRDAAEALGGLSLEDKEPHKDRRVWCYCSDTEVRLVSVDEVLSARAYLAFYEKV